MTQKYRNKYYKYLTTPDFKAEICGPLEVPPYKQTDFMPHGDPASLKTSAICHENKVQWANV